MKNLRIILIVILLLSSCKLFEREDKNDNRLKHFDYNLGETFDIIADSSIVLRDSTYNQYFTLWFSGPVTEHRVPKFDCDPNNSDGSYLTSAMMNLKLLNETADTFNVELEILSCALGTSKEQVVSFGNDSLVFTVEQLFPYPESYDDSITFENYVLTINLNKELQTHILVGSFSGKRTFLSDTTWIEFDIIFEDSMYYGNYPDTLGSCCYGQYKRANDYLLFSNYCMYFFDGIDEWRQIWALKGPYKYEFDGDTLRFWNEDGWVYNEGIEYIFTKN